MPFTTLQKFYSTAFAVLALAAGLAHAEPAKARFPDALTTEGMVVFEVARHPVAISGPQIWISEAEIDGKRYRGLLQSGSLFAVVLPPGEHVLESLHGESPNRQTSFFGGVTVGYHPGAKWPTNRTFTIEAGKVTSLGGMLFMENKPNERGFRLAYIDSSATPPSLMAANPMLGAAIGPDKLLTAPGEYVTPAQLTALRTEMLEAKFKTMTPTAIANANFVAGDAGSFAWLVKGAGNAASLKVVDPGTFRFRKCREWGAGAACYLTDDSVLLIDAKGKKIVHHPVDFEVNDFLAFGDSIVLIDPRFRLLISRDGGRNWALDESLKVEKGTIALFALLGAGAKGFYVHSTQLFGKPEVKRLLYSPYEKLALRLIDMPPEIEKIDFLLETEQGLYVVFRTAKNTAPVYYLADGQTQWEKKAIIPGWGCNRLYADRNDSKHLTAICSSNTESNAKEFLSDDGALNWRNGPQTSP